jgi:hypothetical protein
VSGRVPEIRTFISNALLRDDMLPIFCGSVPDTSESCIDNIETLERPIFSDSVPQMNVFEN